MNFLEHRDAFLLLLLLVDDHGEMRVDAQNWAAAAIESKKDEKEISRAIKVCITLRRLGHWHYYSS